MESRAVAASATQQMSLPRPIRVLAVIPESSARASMIFARRQTASLQQAGTVCETFFLASRTSPWILIKEWRRLHRMAKSFRPDLLHAHYGTVTAFLSAVSASVPLVVTYRGSDLNPSSSVSWARGFAGRLLSQLAALRARQIICVSAQLRERLWWKKHCTTVIPSGVDTALFFPRPRNEARAKLGWGNCERVILFNAGDPKLKRLDLAQAAVEAATMICGEIRFVVLNGDVAAETIPVMMGAADCLLLTSDWEGSPNVVKEAMACNLPVVTVDAGDVRARLEGVSPSRIVDRDPEEIAKALAEILIQRKRSNGSSRIEELSESSVARRIISIYRTANRKRSEDKLCAAPFTAERPVSSPMRAEPNN
jgi:teichuronic acid biosynthesis glycosyltransferase TuaC